MLQFLSNAFRKVLKRSPDDDLDDDRIKRTRSSSYQPSLQFQQFISSLQKANYNEADKTIKLSDAYLFGNEKYGNTLFIRDCYPNLYALLIEKIKNVYGALLKGNPGIGKSCFIVYYLWKVMKEEKPRRIVWWDIKSSTLHQIDLIGGEYKAIKEYSEFSAGLLNPDVYFIYDAGVKGTAAPVAAIRHYLCVSSSSTEHYKYFLDYAEFYYYMPVWNYKEIMYCYDVVYKSVLNASVEDIETRFETYGGQARAVFSVDAYGRLKRFNDLFNDNPLKDIMDAKGELESSSAFSRQLIHYEVDEESENKYRDYHYKFASVYVEKTLIEKHLRKLSNDIVRFLMESSSMPNLGVIRGRIFENVAHRSLIKHGSKDYKVLSLADGEEDEYKIPINRYSILENWGKISDLAIGEYGLPLSQIAETGDAVMKLSDKIGAVFQMTVSKTKILKKKGLKDIMDGFGKEFTTFHFYLLVPEDIYDHYKNEKKLLQYEGGKAVQQKIKQFLLLLPLSPNTSFDLSLPSPSRSTASTTTTSQSTASTALFRR